MEIGIGTKLKYKKSHPNAPRDMSILNFNRDFQIKLNIFQLGCISEIHESSFLKMDEKHVLRWDLYQGQEIGYCDIK